MTGDETDLDDSTPGGRSRRAVLSLLGGVASTPIGAVTAYRADRSFTDEDGDGIPDHRERSVAFDRYLHETFGDRFDGLDPERKDLLIDARYVGDVSVSAETKAQIEGLFRENGIHAQWLDHPRRYDPDRITLQYGTSVRDLLWGRDSFYRTEIESKLRNVAVQLLVVAGRAKRPYKGRIYSPWMATNGSGAGDGYVNGFNVGNRAIVAERTEQRDEARLILHELAHYGLCHDDDPANDGVMGTGATIDLTEREWALLRRRLDNVHDTTGYDVAFRRCLWAEQVSGYLDSDCRICRS